MGLGGEMGLKISRGSKMEWERERLRCDDQGGWSLRKITPKLYRHLYIFFERVNAILRQRDSTLLLYAYCYYTHCISYSYRYCFLTFALDVSVNIRRRDFPFPARTTNLYRRIDECELHLWEIRNGCYVCYLNCACTRFTFDIALPFPL